MLALGGHRLSECDLVCDEVPGDVDWSVAQVEDDQEGGGVARLTHVGLPKELLECGLEDDSVPSVTPPISATYGEIVIRDSTDVHIGNKTFYNGAVTIKQFVFPPKGEEEDVKKLPQGNGTLARSQTHLCEPPPVDSIPSSKWNYLKSPYVIVSSTAVVVAITLLTVFLVVNLKPSSVDPEDAEILPGNSTVRIIKRREWFAERDTKYDNIDRLSEVPPPFVVVIHTVTGNCRTVFECSSIVRNLQVGHIGRGYDDIGYNFLVGGDGNVYVGRGWTKRGAHSIPMNGNSIGLAFIGNFNKAPPTRPQLKAAKRFLEEGEAFGKLKRNYTVLLQKQVTPSESPGSYLSEEVKKWPSWRPCRDECARLVTKFFKLPEI